MGYLQFLRRLHQRVQPDWYLEVGTARGRSLGFVACNAIAIDPRFRLAEPTLGAKPVQVLLQMTSDAAFAGPVMARLDPRFDLAFLDGMHRFEVLLRDLINTERHMAPNGMIVLHDTAPYTARMTGRDALPGPWTGDVWKLLPILAEHRPDLRVDHLDCAHTGLTLIRGPWGGCDALDRHHDAIVERYAPLDLATWGPARFYRDHAPVSALGVLETV